MTIHHIPRNTVHPAAKMYVAEHETGQLSRREFLTRATAPGLSSSAAFGLIGLPAPARAESNAQMGGTLRMEMETKAMKDPPRRLGRNPQFLSRLARLSCAVRDRWLDHADAVGELGGE